LQTPDKFAFANKASLQLALLDKMQDKNSSFFIGCFANKNFVLFYCIFVNKKLCNKFLIKQAKLVLLGICCKVNLNYHLKLIFSFAFARKASFRLALG